MKHIQKRIFALAGITAVLLAGCAEQTAPEAAEVTWQDGTVLHLTDQTDNPGMHGLAETGSGMFFYANALHYYDSESGEAIYLCARPNCLHNGDEFCPATTPNYQIISEPVYLDGFVYAVALDQTEQLSQSNAKYRTVLLRYAADGTEITKVADLREDAQDKNHFMYEVQAKLIVHRGQLWMKCSYSHSIMASDSTLGRIETTNLGGYEMFVYAPANGSVKKFAGTDDLLKDFEVRSTRENLTGAGDSVYYIKTNSNWQDPLKGDGIFRIDCTTGEIENLIKPGFGRSILYYAAAGDKIVYEEHSHSNLKDAYAGFQIYDLTTGETKELVTVEDMYRTADSQPDADAEPRYVLEYLLCDAEHVFVCWSDWGNSPGERKEFLSVYGWDGGFQQTVSFTLPRVTDSVFVEQEIKSQADYLEKEEIEDLRENGIADELFLYQENPPYNYTDGVFYFKGMYREYSLTLADVLEGKSDITPLYTHRIYS